MTSTEERSGDVGATPLERGRHALRQLWRRDRAALIILAASSVLHTVAWRAMTRPMGDSVSYRAAADTIFSGWGSVTDRTPGYPTVLWLTGSADHETHLLFVLQLLLHAVAVVGTLSLARTCGLGRRGRLVVVLLLVSPPVMVNVALTGTEVVSEVLLVSVAWCGVRGVVGRSPLLLGCTGASLALLALARPSNQLLWIPVAWVVWRRLRRTGGVGAHRPGLRPVRSAALVAIPALVAVVALVTFNATRFDSPSMTPMTAWHLSTRTSGYVEDLPASEEPARSALIRSRDERLLDHEEHRATDYAFRLRSDLREITGKDDRELDRYMMRLDLMLIADNPFAYLGAVLEAGVLHIGFNSNEAAFAGSPALGQLMMGVHWLLVAVGAVALIALGGLALTGRLRSRPGAPLALAAAVAGYSALVACATEIGAPRVRSPTDPLLVLLVVVGLATIRAERAAVRSR
ncbi:MAG: hypothetical protein ACR2JF_17130 [Iamia sp.]